MLWDSGFVDFRVLFLQGHFQDLNFPGFDSSPKPRISLSLFWGGFETREIPFLGGFTTREILFLGGTETHKSRSNAPNIGAKRPASGPKNN